ncbi:MAG: hypothetical protein KA954_11030 [Chitinophagales bacterium]|nr:hypothetical protein [Chitinophagales bacterium]
MNNLITNLPLLNEENIFRNYQILIQNTKQENKLKYEKLKLQIICHIERSIEEKIQPSNVRQEVLNNHGLSKFAIICKWGVYYLLTILGIIKNAARNYIFITTLLVLFPSLTQIVTLVASLLYILFDTVVFSGFEHALLKNVLGIPANYTELELIFSIYAEQLFHMKKLFRLLLIYENLAGSSSAIQYRDICNLFYQDLNQKISQLNTEYTRFRIALIILMVAFGAISSIAGSYFMMSIILKTFAAGLIGTPLGWAIVFLGILTDLGFYYVMGASGMMRLINGDIEKSRDIKQKFNAFNHDYGVGFFDRDRKLQHNFKRNSLVDVAVQTEYLIAI